jgi:hypothetical protein
MGGRSSRASAGGYPFAIAIVQIIAAEVLRERRILWSKIIEIVKFVIRRSGVFNQPGGTITAIALRTSRSPAASATFLAWSSARRSILSRTALRTVLAFTRFFAITAIRAFRLLLAFG